MLKRSIFPLIITMSLGFLSSCRHATDPVVAKVGDAQITVADLEMRLGQMPAANRQYVSTPEGQRQFLDLLIREKVLLLEARKAGLQNDPTYGTAVARFKEDLKRQLEEYKESILIESYLKRLRVTALAVTDADVERYYNEHRDAFTHPVELLACHILLSTQSDADAALARLKKGESFEALAQEVSKDPTTAVRGGRMSPFQRGKFPPDFEAAAFALKTGEISGVVKTQFGFHIIKKNGEKPLPAQTLEQAKETIRAEMERDKFNEWVAARQTALGVHVNDQAMSQVHVAIPSQEPSSL